MTEQRRRNARLGFLKHLVLIGGKPEGYLEDLTPGGAGLVLTRVPREGETVACVIRFHPCLKLPDLQLQGNVRWVAPSATGSARVGIQFPSPEVHSLAIIKRYMAHASRVQQGRDRLP